MVEYKDKEVKNPYLPINVKKHSKKLPTLIVIIVLVVVFTFIKQTDILSVSSTSAYDDDDGYRAKLVKFESDYKDKSSSNKASTNEKVQHIDLKDIPKHPHAVNENHKGTGVRVDKNGYSVEDDIDTTMDSKVIGSISKDNTNNGESKNTLQKLKESEFSKGKISDETGKAAYDNKNKVASNSGTTKQSIPAAEKDSKKELNDTPTVKKPTTTKSTITNGNVVPTAPLGGNKNNYDHEKSTTKTEKTTNEKPPLKPLPVILPANAEGPNQLLILQDEETGVIH